MQERRKYAAGNALNMHKIFNAYALCGIKKKRICAKYAEYVQYMRSTYSPCCKNIPHKHPLPRQARCHECTQGQKKKGRRFIPGGGKQKPSLAGTSVGGGHLATAVGLQCFGQPFADGDPHGGLCGEGQLTITPPLSALHVQCQKGVTGISHTPFSEKDT